MSKRKFIAPKVILTSLTDDLLTLSGEIAPAYNFDDGFNPWGDYTGLD